MKIKRYTKPIHSQKGFTLIELLVVVAILGVLAAIAIPNLARFIGFGHENVRDTECNEMQGCVGALMAEPPVSGLITGAPVEFGNTAQDGSTQRVDLTVDGKNLSDYIVGGIVKCLGHYSVDADGNVTQIWYPE